MNEKNYAVVEYERAQAAVDAALAAWDHEQTAENWAALQAAGARAFELSLVQ